MSDIPKFRVVRREDAYFVQKWIPKSWFVSPGWKDVSESGRSRTDAVALLSRYVEMHLPDADDEPLDSIKPEGEQLRKNCVDNPNDDGMRLIYADWLEENGLVNNAARIRLRIEAKRMVPR